MASSGARTRAGAPALTGARAGLARGRLAHVVIPLVVSGIFAAVFVGADVIVRSIFPAMSTALRHGLLTAQAAVVTAAASAVVYLMMRRQHRRIATTAGQLARLLESYQANHSTAQRFENPHLVHCRDVFDCKVTDCPMYDSPGERCWQVMALSRAGRSQANGSIDIQQCHECAVYRVSCPDKLTELGESFNNLMFLLAEEAERVARMRAQMLEKEKMVAIGQIAAGIAHEVGNPLSSISSVVQMLKRPRSKAPMTEQLDLIETHIQRISATVRQLVSLARPGAEQWEPVDIGQTLEEAVKLISFDRRAGNVDVVFEPPGPLPCTYGLRGQLQQVFINLSLNALDAMPDGGRLTIQALKRRGRIIVRIEDTGCGISPEVGRRVFEPFFTTKQPGQGTGLGLAVSYGIVQKHGGTIDFSSTVGQGTVFTVELPVLDKAPDV